MQARTAVSFKTSSGENLLLVRGEDLGSQSVKERARRLIQLSRVSEQLSDQGRGLYINSLM